MIGICGGNGFQPSRPRGPCTLSKILKAGGFRTTFKFDDSDLEKRFDAVLYCKCGGWAVLCCIFRGGWKSQTGGRNKCGGAPGGKFQTLINFRQGTVATVLAREEADGWAADFEEAVITDIQMPYLVNTKPVAAGEELRFYKAEVPKDKKKADSQPITTAMLLKKQRKA